MLRHAEKIIQAYSDPSRAGDPHALPDVEVFFLRDEDIRDCDPDSSFYGLPGGFYWWSCFPGCLPDGEPIGPYETAAEAQADAQADAGYDDWRATDGGC